jgi:GNAT superfamily N-acetyltransferase
MEPADHTLMWVPVTDLAQVEIMRQIFNECLPFMTKPFDQVTFQEQQTWWKSLHLKVLRWKAFLYKQDGLVVAYSLLQWHHDGRITPLFGIRKEARGKNLARQIIQHYLREADGPLHGEERSDHAAIIKMNQEAGWQLLREEKGVRYLYHPNEKREYPDYKGMLEYWGIG